MWVRWSLCHDEGPACPEAAGPGGAASFSPGEECDTPDEEQGDRLVRKRQGSFDTAVQAYVAWAIGYAPEADLVQWAAEHLSTHPDEAYPDLVALAGLGRQEAENAPPYLYALLKRRCPAFQLKSSTSEAIARGLLRRRGEDYLAGACTPYELCRLVHLIEDVYGFPVWLGKLYDACDWIEPGTEPRAAAYLAEEVHKVLQVLGLKTRRPADEAPRNGDASE